MSRTKCLVTGPAGTALPIFKPGTTTVVSITNATSASAAMGSGTKAVRIAAKTDTWLAFGSLATAVLSGGILHPAGWVETYLIEAGEKVAGIRDSADGCISITQLAVV